MTYLSTTTPSDDVQVNVDVDAPLDDPELKADGGDQHPEKTTNDDADHRPLPGDDDFDENNAPLEFVVNEWAQGTSIHGVPYVTDSQQWRFWKRATWIFLVLVSSAFMIWQCTSLFNEYSQHDVITDTQTINEGKLDFPEVTVCSSNLYSQWRKEKYGIEDPATDEEIDLVSPNLEELIAKTWFNGDELNTSEVWKPTILYGKCWTFSTDMKTRRPGYYAGLKFWMDLNQDDFEDSTELAGAFVWTLQPGTNVSIHQIITGCKPGKESFVAMEMVEHVREKEAPWARCDGIAPEYTQFKCRDECVHTYIRETCQCRELQDRTDQSMRLCRRSGEDAACIKAAIANEDEILAQCDCNQPPCYELNYQPALIEVDASQKGYTAMTKAYNKSEEYVRNNFLAITVNYKSMQFTRLTESKGMSASQLLGAIGGSMGFFLGISLVSIFELLGDLVGMRLMPRFFGHKNLYGVGARYKLD